jgi:tetratricopeptide (TPR) repeat protein
MPENDHVPAYPSIPAEDSPDGTPIDPRVFAVLDSRIRQADERGNTVVLNNLQRKVAIAYIRFCQKTGVMPEKPLAAAAFAALKAENLTSDPLFGALQKSKTVMRLQSVFASAAKDYVPDAKDEATVSQKRPPSIQEHLQMIQTAMQQGRGEPSKPGNIQDYQEAVALAERAVVAHPESAPILYAAAVCQMLEAGTINDSDNISVRIRRLETAVELLKQCLEKAKRISELQKWLKAGAEKLDLAIAQHKLAIKKQTEIETEATAAEKIRQEKQVKATKKPRRKDEPL